jgi:hypothetical protein
METIQRQFLRPLGERASMQFKSTADGSISKWRAACVAGAFIVLLTPSGAHAANLQWAGRSWKVTSGGMAGVAEGSPSNVSVDSDGYLHLKITNTAGTWTAAELFTTDQLGFGTYQWQVDGPIDRFDKNVVLGLYPYGPAAGIGQDGTNEIDIEYSVWGHAGGVNGDWTDYPSTGKTIGETSYNFSLNGGTYSTSRFIWNATSIQDFLITGFQPVGSTTDLVKTWTYAPSDPTTNIPQQAMPLGINLWCFDAPPSDGKDVEVIIRDFEFVAEGTSPGGAGGTGGMASAGANAGGMSAGGMSAGGMSQGGASQGGGNAGGAAGTGTGGMTAGGGSAAGASGVSSSVGGATSSSAAGGAGTSGVTSNGAGGAATSSAGTPGSAASSGETATPSNSSDSGGCRFSPTRSHTQWTLLAALPLLALGRRLRRRRAERRRRQR